jgi:hypothetical protein
MKFVGLYFQVLFKEIKIVQSEHGFAKALLSNAFLTDIIPGIVMFFLFGQLQLLALPVIAASGAEYSNPELMVEQLVVLLSNNDMKVNWFQLDSRIKEANQVSSDHGVHILVVPTFKPLTEIILKIARKFPEAQLLELSNQQSIQVKVTLPSSTPQLIITEESEATLLSKLKTLHGCEVMFSYRCPVDGTPSTRVPLSVSLRVSTLSLIRLIQLCSTLRITVNQVYDFYN